MIYISNKTRRIIFWSLLALAITMILLIIVMTPCMTELVFKKDISKKAGEISLMVMIPFMVATNCISFMKWFETFNKEQAIQQLDKQFNSGLISIEKYAEMYSHIYDFDTEKKLTKIKIIQKQAEVKKKAVRSKKEIKENLDEKIKTND